MDISLTTENVEQTKLLSFFASCAKGIELLLKDELLALGVDEAREKLAGVEFEADLATAYKVCLWSRLANQVHRKLHVAKFDSADAFYNELYSLPWASFFDVTQSIKIELSGKHQVFNNTQFAAQKAKDAVVDYFRDQTDERPNVDLEHPDIVINIHLQKGMAFIYLSLTGQSLHRRGYRLAQGEAPLKETLAAALLVKSGWLDELKKDQVNFIDPMCGSGTILIEAAMMAYEIAPNLTRDTFCFMHWRDFDHNAWQALKSEALMRKNMGKEKSNITLIGYDDDMRVLDKARQNIDRADLVGAIEVFVQDVRDFANDAHEKTGFILTNPPYGERLYHGRPEKLRGLFSGFGKALIRDFSGWKVSIFSAASEPVRALGLRAMKVNKFFNGALETMLYQFEVSDQWVMQHESATQKLTRQAKNAVLQDDGHLAFKNRLLKNYQQIQKWAQQQELECYRIYDADLPEYAVAIDLYNTHVHVQEYQMGKTVDEKLAQKRLLQAVYHIAEVLEVRYEHIHLKTRQRQKGDSQYQRQAITDKFHVVKEHDALFYVNFDDYLDTGLFLDHRKMRQIVAKAAQGKTLLNLFSYTCSASVHAALVGAQVVSVDMSKTYLDWGKRNFHLNKLNIDQHVFIQADCFTWLKEAVKARKQFDVIFLDPPTFSNSKRMQNVLDVQRDHVELIELAMRLLTRKGVLYFSNNYRKFKFDEGLQAKYDCQNIDDKCLSRDFLRRPTIHHCWQISAKSNG
ncbi:bifunctional 23S rRNA (guanine(2069)-N(7))-methyltransferase RlmK/23S rRNA (guanine(2445)-N(2))-methyltransferase RlmL [Cysteiniphilum sp. JM-1]|uniref:bifunctional 23S rRNA (guanine(2069)-N(7))-methyltransferase RlmK/23S rRNA (guanine(2445)-N(2))-methyltransferase RlmL n=1 Tax=Cysteiniphilum sp. JM-1 TaxID=2610891 RepID=UPI001246768A|nr:bifunctional 23S rRNA (guanine(2069)-N(7))-methyltransferase RlmK/23S rRNA (guanine(2445)-N(2))-methyltransferase RlmL [Cysteiniphilum sp. JM-1]